MDRDSKYKDMKYSLEELGLEVVSIEKIDNGTYRQPPITVTVRCDNHDLAGRYTPDGRSTGDIMDEYGITTLRVEKQSSQ